MTGWGSGASKLRDNRTSERRGNHTSERRGSGASGSSSGKALA